MSYAASLLATYPSSYGPSTLLSDDLINHSTFDHLYQTQVPYMSSGRLLSDDLAFNQINYDAKTYRPPLYSIGNSTSVYPTTNYAKTLVTNQRKTIPPNDSFASLNDITEYSDSLATASNTNTASSVARSINDNYMDGPANMFLNYQPNFNRMSNSTNDSPQIKSNWGSPQTKQNIQSDKIKAKSTTRTQPSTIIQKQSSANELNDDITPVQSPQPPMILTKQPSQLQRNVTINDMSKQTSSIDIQAWVNDAKKESSIDEKAAEQAWSVKIDQLHHLQAQRVKEKAKSSRALPLAPKKVDNKQVRNKPKSIADTTYQMSHDSYFDSLFDDRDFFRNPLTNDYALNSSYHQKPISKKNKYKTNSLSTSNLNNLSQTSKHVPQRKAPRYEPPTTKRPPPIITTTSWKKTLPKEFHLDTTFPNYIHGESAHHDFIHKDTDERFREALQKLRQDRAEQQHKEINEKTAKRLHYGDYVRHSTKDALLQNAVKPSPWSDFMHLKKGNLYSLSKEEKKQLYNQSKSYGERIRYRNFAIHYGDETARAHRHSVPLLNDVQEPESDKESRRQRGSKSVSRTSRRPDSASTNKSHTKQTTVRVGGGNRIIPNQISRTNRHTDDEYENQSDHDTNRKFKQQFKKKNVRYAKYDSSGRTTTSGTESENELDNHSQRSVHTKNRDVNDDLFTVREEKTLESIEGARYKKRQIHK